MKGDFSRLTFDIAHHFSRVLSQQGRVTLDADANEQTEILLHMLRTMARDLFGPYGGPIDATRRGFKLALEQRKDGWHLLIGGGHYYVGGILVESNDSDFVEQPMYGPPAADWPAGDKALLEWLKNPVANKPFWIYLEVWERHVTWIEDASIREVALGASGPDTCTRSQVVWQVKALPWNADWGDFNSSKTPCSVPLQDFVGDVSDAAMAAQLSQGAQIADPCVIAPGAQYRGAENQLYRVEIHDGGGAGEATFKWSRDNGSVATRLLGTEGNDLIVTHARGFSGGTWVELSDDASDFAGAPGVMVNLVKVQADRLTIDPASASGPFAWNAKRSNPKVRRWDQRENDVTIFQKKGVMSIVESDPAHPQWIDLEDGIQVAFDEGGQYRTGDYWLIPARAATGGIEWTPDAPGSLLKRPFGVAHYYAPLGIIDLAANGNIAQSVHSCLVCVAPRIVNCTPTPPPPDAAPDVAEPQPGAAPRRRPRKKGSQGSH